MGFAHVQGNSNSTGLSVTTLNVVLGAAPTQGNIVCVAFVPSDAVTLVTVKDSNNNSYTVTTNSPSTFQSGAGQVWLAYLLSAPANATATITVSWTTSSTGAAAWADEFSISGGTASFDKDIAANTGVAGTTINTPSITPSGSEELLYAAAAAGGFISAPAANGTLGVWTGSSGAIANGDMAEYDLSASAGTAVQFTQTSGAWSAMAMAFTFGGGPRPNVTFAISTTSTSNVTSYATGSLTPAVGDLLLVFVVASATVDAGAVTESLSEVTFTKITSALKATSADTLYAFIANGFLTTAGARTVTFSCPGDAATGAIVTVYRIANMGRKGLFAVRQSAVQSNQAAAGTPAPAFTNAALTTNPVLGLVGNAAASANFISQPSGNSPTWNEGSDNVYSTPSTGSETIWINSGFSGTTITWGSASATAFGDIIVEIDGSASFPPVSERHRAGHFEPHYLANF